MTGSNQSLTGLPSQHGSISALVSALWTVVSLKPFLTGGLSSVQSYVPLVGYVARAQFLVQVENYCVKLVRPPASVGISRSFLHVAEETTSRDRSVA